MSHQNVARLAGESWGEAVNRLIGPRLVSEILDSPNPRRLAALDLAASALLAAGEHELAAEALKRKW